MDGSEIQLPDKIVEIFPICVISDHYPSLYFQTRQFLRVNTSEVVNPPYIMDVFFLDVVTEFLTHPIRMLDYLKKRTSYNESVSANNDFAVFGYHLSYNLYRNPEFDMMMLNDDLSWEVDKAFTMRRERGISDALPKGILTTFSGTPYEKIINYIGDIKEEGVVEFGYLVLSYDGISIDGLNRGITELTRKAKTTNRTHDFVVGGPEGGLTYHISRTPSEQRMEKLLEHAKFRKYSQKAKTWFAVSGTIGGGEPVDTVCILDYPWKRDLEFDLRLSKSVGRPKNYHRLPEDYW